MNVYVAGGLKNTAQVKAAIAKIEAAGHQITRDWTTMGDVTSQPGWEKVESYGRLVAGVQSANVFVLLEDKASRGAYAELGIAIVTPTIHAIYIVSDGRKASAFYSCPKVKVVTDLDQIHTLNGR